MAKEKKTAEEQLAEIEAKEKEAKTQKKEVPTSEGETETKSDDKPEGTSEKKSTPKKPKSVVSLENVLEAIKDDAVTHKTDKAGLCTLNVEGFIPALLKSTAMEGVSVYERGDNHKWVVMDTHINSKEELEEFVGIVDRFVSNVKILRDSLVPEYSIKVPNNDFISSTKWDMIGEFTRVCIEDDF
jgi:hypothetical protein